MSRLSPNHRATSRKSDDAYLRELGYEPVLTRRMGPFGNFAISFSVISVLSGCMTLYGFGLNTGGPSVMLWGWLVVGAMVMFIGAALAEVTSAYPTSGALYYQAEQLGGRKWGWYTGWLNLLGLLGAIAGIDYSDTGTSDVTAIDYDPAGHRTSMTDGTGTSAWSYNTFGELTSQTDGAGSTVGYTYDENSNTTGVTYPGTTGHTVTRTFDKADRLTGVKDWNGNSTTFGYTDDGQWKTTTYPNGTAATTSYDDAGQAKSDTLTKGATTLASLTYTRDGAGQLSGQTPTGVPGDAQSYQYTDREQLKSATAGSTVTSFAYDDADNPVQVGTSGQSFDAANQLCWSTTGTMPANPDCSTAPSGATTYTYDAQGNRTKSTDGSNTTTYAYDQSDRLATANTGSATATYAYNGDGLRTAKTVGSTTTSFTWDAEDIPDLLSDSTTDYVYGPAGMPVEQIASGSAHWYFHDQLGSTRALTDSSGTVDCTYNYSPYGAVLGHTGTASTPMQYTGQYTDAETGFVYLRARYYDPSTAQFLTIDPDVASTLEAYAYAVGNPLNVVDPLGLWGWNPISDIKQAASDVGKHWRGITQTAIVATAIVATTACTIATAGICAGAGGVIISAGIGFAAGVGAYEVGAGKHTVKGAVQSGAIGAAEYGSPALLSKLSMLGSTASYLRFGDVFYNAATRGGKFWKNGENMAKVLNHCGFGTTWP